MKAQLTIVEVPHGAAQTAVCDALLRDLAARGERAVRLVATSDAARATMRRLADAGTPALGVETTTLDDWARGRWALYGDGRAIVSTAQRRALVMRALEQPKGEALPHVSAGMVACVEGIAREGAGAAAFEGALQPGAKATEELSAAERELLDVCASYLRDLERSGLVELGAACTLLPGAMGRGGWSHLVLEGIRSLTEAQLGLLAAAAGQRGLTYVARLGANPAFAAARELAGRLEAACAAQGVPVVRLTCDNELTAQQAAELGLPCLSSTLEAGLPSPWRAPELEELAEALFAPVHGEPVEAQGCVRFCLPAGRYAEPELLATTILNLVWDGYAPRDIVVACPDPLATAATLAGRLAQNPGRAVACLAHGSVSLAETNVASLLTGLLELACARDPEAPAPQLRAVAAGVARNPLAGIGTHAATQLDRAWRGRRASCARDYLRDLAQAADERTAALAEKDGAPASAVANGPAVGDAATLTNANASEKDGAAASADTAEPASPLARAIELVLAGDLAGAADVLGTQVAGAGVEARAERAAAARAGELARCYGKACAGRLGPEEWRALTAGVGVPTSWASVPASDVAAQRIAAVMDSNPNAVRFVRPSELEGCSASAVVLCGLMADAYSVADRTGARETLWRKLGINPGPARIDEMRWQMRCALEAARDVLVLERRLQDEDAKELRPAALLEELIDCYRDDPTCDNDLDRATGLPKEVNLPRCTLGEERFAGLAAPVTLAPATVEAPLPALVPSRPESRDLLIRPGQLWSPSALELYLRCPLRWFSERRLPNERIDAAFGPLEFGSFSHRVLQVFHERLPQLGIARIEPNTPSGAWEPLFETCFDEVLAEQDCSQNPLVPISKLEREKVEAARRGLRSCVARDAQLPAEFVPRRHEWSFGMGASPAIEYGSVLLRGTVDRIDEDAQGRALVIDYKGSLGEGYEPPRAKKGQDPSTVDPLPLHAQALMYAGALQRAEGRTVAGALYVSYAKPVATGFLDTAVVGHLDSEKGAYLGERCAVHPAPDGGSGFVQLLDRVEAEVAAAMDRLRDGDVGPNPRFGAKSCARCSVAGCPKRAGT